MPVSFFNLHDGQTVKLKPRRSCSELHIGIARGMYRFFGKKVTVSIGYYLDPSENRIYLKEDINDFAWDCDWIAKVYIDKNYTPPVLNDLF